MNVYSAVGSRQPLGLTPLSLCVPQPRLSIVIVTRDVRDLLRGCLASVRASVTPFEREVFVVDTGSADGTREMLAAEFPEVALLVEPDDRGYAAANNLALRRCRGAFLLLLNPDTVLPPDALARAVHYLEQHRDAGLLGVKLVKADGTLDLACRRSFPTPRTALYHFLGFSRRYPSHPAYGAYNLTHLDPEHTSEVDSVCGAFMLIRREVVDAVGLLDERYWMYGEDLDLAYRSRLAGWRTVYFPRVTVLHLKGQASRQRSLRCTYEFFRAMHIFYRKYYAPKRPFYINVLVTGGIVALAAARLVADRLTPAHRRRVST